ncbi:PEP-CTERM sorting domain-containing protein [Inhella crocodyli]|uniref:PEP-CTERM sorting domain-containing protein n=1 Tax=Inhella crocodyli TaxID=2499851 RepID=A0A437LHC9_9BURK|nr:PEP-CTERM sorting domain-containing protein [Inhella crocodyli]RVT84788.1 PEP-CTERM sorting domain-containing protein [Inhella crocodyli]
MNAFRCAVSALALVAATAAQADVVVIPQTALNDSPGVYTAGGYYTTNLGPNIVTTGGGNAANVGNASGRNDDGFMQLALGFNVTYFGTTYNSLYINNNGNVSFGAGISAFVPTGPTGANAPVISPWFGDVDTRNAGSGLVHYNLSADQLIVTWDRVGYFSNNASALNSFQLVLRSDLFEVPVGEGKIGFFYQGMGWERTSTSTVAAVGFGDGQGNSKVLAGSTTAGLNAVVQNQYLWFDANLDVVPPTDVPEPATLALVGLGLIGAGVARRRKRAA